jgi:hypothetical protein
MDDLLRNQNNLQIFSVSDQNPHQKQITPLKSQQANAITHLSPFIHEYSGNIPSCSS